MVNRTSAEVFPPGEFIREELEARAWTQGDLAEIMGRPPQVVSEIISAKKQITPETARELAAAFGSDDALYWLNLESAYRLAKVDAASDLVERRSRLYSKFPVREMLKRKWIEASDSIDVIEHRVCRFHNISNINESPSLRVS